jgi:hypothetical protein
MKRSLLPGILFVILLSVFSAFSVFGGKNRLITSADLDHAYVQGATVKYQLTPEEGGGFYSYSNGTPVTRMNAVIILDYTAIDNRRDEKGSQLFKLRVSRPAEIGGDFEKDAPYSSGREAGSFDGLQPGDLVH